MDVKDLKPELPELNIKLNRYLQVDLNRYLKIDTKYIVYSMILAYTIGFSYYTIMKHYTFQTGAYDLGIFLNSFYNTLHEGRFLYTTLWEGSRFQNHFSPILLLILPIYAIFPKVETLLILQSFILAIGALPIYWIAKNEINKKAGLVFALLYLIYPALHSINKFDFHEVAFAPAFILFAFHYYKQNKFGLSSLFIILALISREDVAMVVVPMAIIWLWDIKNKSIRNKETIFCSLVVIIGGIWFLTTTGGYEFFQEAKPANILLDLNNKVLYMVNIFLPLLFIPLFNRLILVTFPIFARNLLSDKSTRFEINNQYNALIIPFAFLSSIYFIKHSSEHINVQTKTLFSKRLMYPMVIICIIISFFTGPVPTEIAKNSIIPIITVVPEGGPQPIIGIIPITPHDKALNQIIGTIPKNASIYVQSNLFSHMADRPKVYYVSGDSHIFKGWNNQIGLLVPWQSVTDFDYILVDDNIKSKSMLRNADIDTLEKIKENYGLYGAIDGIYLFKKGYFGANNVGMNGTNGGTYNGNYTNNFLPSLLENFDNGFIPSFYNGIIIDYYNNNNLTGYPVTIDRASGINFNWKKEISPLPPIINTDNFSIKFEGYLYIPANGSYTFELFSDDGSRFFIDDQLVVDTWLSIPPIKEFYKTNLDIGLHKIRMDYKQKVNNAYIILNWFTPWKGIFESIPEEYFYVPKENRDNIYNGGNIINPLSTIINNNEVIKMKNDNTVAIDITPVPTPQPTQIISIQQTPINSINNTQVDINSIPLDTINSS